jgi:hypothetical protein
MERPMHCQCDHSGGSRNGCLIALLVRHVQKRCVALDHDELEHRCRVDDGFEEAARDVL